MLSRRHHLDSFVPLASPGGLKVINWGRLVSHWNLGTVQMSSLIGVEFEWFTLQHRNYPRVKTVGTHPDFQLFFIPMVRQSGSPNSSSIVIKRHNHAKNHLQANILFSLLDMSTICEHDHRLELWVYVFWILGCWAPFISYARISYIRHAYRKLNVVLISRLTGKRAQNLNSLWTCCHIIDISRTMNIFAWLCRFY